MRRAHRVALPEAGKPKGTVAELVRCIDDFNRLCTRIHNVKTEIDVCDQAAAAYRRGLVHLIVDDLLNEDEARQGRARHQLHVLGELGEEIAATLAGRQNAKAASGTRSHTTP